MRILRVIFKWIFIICLPVLLLSSSIAWGFNSLWLYNYGFQKYNVSQTTGLSADQLEKVGRNFIDYLNSDDEYVQIMVFKVGRSFELFNTEEQIHFKDVKQLILLDYRILLIALILVLAYVVTSIFWRHGRYRQQLARNIIWGSGLTIALILVMGVASMLDFDQLWLQFHYLVFTNPYWSAEGYMLLLFGDLWYDAILIGIAFMAGLAIVLGILALLYLRLARGKQLNV